MAMRQSDQNFLYHRISRLEVAIEALKQEEDARAYRYTDGVEPETYSPVLQGLYSFYDDLVLRLLTQGDGHFDLHQLARINGGEFETRPTKFGHKVLDVQSRCKHTETRTVITDNVENPTTWFRPKADGKYEVVRCVHCYKAVSTKAAPVSVE